MVDAGAITAHIDMQMPMWVMPHEYSNYKREILCNECQVVRSWWCCFVAQCLVRYC